MADRSALLDAIDDDEALRVLLELVRIPSPTGGEERITAFVERYARDADLGEVGRDAHGNVLIALRAAAPGPTTLFLTHLDSGGAGGMADPYVPEVVDGAAYGKPGPVVRGLGSCAPKSAVAAMLQAACAARRLGLPARGTVLVAIVTKDMDANHQGPRELLGGMRLAVDRVIAGEPSGNRIVVGARGINRLKITLGGKPAHWGRPSEAANPLYALGPVLDAIERMALPTDPVLGAATMAPFDVSADNAPPRTPERVTLWIDRRTLPSEATTAVVDAVRALVERAIAGRAGITASVELARAMHSWRTPEDGPLVSDVRRIAREALGLELDTTTITFASNAGYAIAERGWPGVALGPGNIGDIGEREHVEIDSLRRATRLYAALMAGG